VRVHLLNLNLNLNPLLQRKKERAMNEPSPNLVDSLKGNQQEDFDKAEAFIKAHPQWAHLFDSWGQPGTLGDLILLVTFKGNIIVNCHINQGMH
jgi:hypothetical protein